MLNLQIISLSSSRFSITSFIQFLHFSMNYKLQSFRSTFSQTMKAQILQFPIPLSPNLAIKSFFDFIYKKKKKNLTETFRDPSIPVSSTAQGESIRSDILQFFHSEISRKVSKGTGRAALAWQVVDVGWAFQFRGGFRLPIHPAIFHGSHSLSFRSLGSTAVVVFYDLHPHPLSFEGWIPNPPLSPVYLTSPWRASDQGFISSSRSSPSSLPCREPSLSVGWRV